MRIAAKVCLVLAFAMARDLMANPSDAKLSGVVSDYHSGSAVPGARITVVGNRAIKDEVTDSQGRFILLFTDDVKQGEVVRIRVQKYGYVVYEEEVPVSPLPWTPRLVKSVPGGKKISNRSSGGAQEKRTDGPSERLQIADGVTALYIPGPNSAGARSVGINTSGVGKQEISILARPRKLFFEPPGVVIGPNDLPRDLQIGKQRITIVAFTSTGFTVDDHGIHGILAHAFVLETSPEPASAQQSPNSIEQSEKSQGTADHVPEFDIRERLSSGKLSEGWTLHKRGNTVTLTLIMDTTGLPSPLIAALDQSNVSIEPDFAIRARALWDEISAKVPEPRLLETENGKIKGQEIWFHLVHYLRRQPNILEWSYEILVNGNGAAQTTETSKLPVVELSSAGRETVSELDALAIHLVNRRYIDATLRISE